MSALSQRLHLLTASCPNLRMNRPRMRRARYQSPTEDECVDMLDDAEFRLATTPRLARLRGRSKAWELHKLNGPLGRLRSLACGDVGDSIVLSEYQAPSQFGPLRATVQREEGVVLKCRTERSLVDGSIVGVRVTLTEFVS